MYQFFHLVTRVRPDQCLRPCPSENRPSFAKVGLAARGRWGRTQSCGRRPRRPVRARPWLILWARSGSWRTRADLKVRPTVVRRYLTDKKLDEASRMPATRSVSTTTRAHGIALKFKRRILFLPSPSTPTSGASYVPTHSAALPSRMAFYPPPRIGVTRKPVLRSVVPARKGATQIRGLPGSHRSMLYNGRSRCLTTYPPAWMSQESP